MQSSDGSYVTGFWVNGRRDTGRTWIYARDAGTTGVPLRHVGQTVTLPGTVNASTPGISCGLPMTLLYSSIR